MYQTTTQTPMTHVNAEYKSAIFPYDFMSYLWKRALGLDSQIRLVTQTTTTAALKKIKNKKKN